MRQNDSERPKFWNLGYFWSCPKNSGVAQKVNGIDQIVTDHFWGLLLNQKGSNLTCMDLKGQSTLFWGFEHVWGPWLKVQKWASCQKSGSEAKEFEHEKLSDSKLDLNRTEWIESDRLIESDRNKLNRIWIGLNRVESDRMDWIRFESDQNGLNRTACIESDLNLKLPMLGGLRYVTKKFDWKNLTRKTSPFLALFGSKSGPNCLEMDWTWFWDGPEGSFITFLRVRPMLKAF